MRKNDGSVVAWGQITKDGSGNVLTTGDISSGVVKIATASNLGFVAFKDDGSLVGLGYGDATAGIDGFTINAADVAEITAGSRATCVRKTDGSVHAAHRPPCATPPMRALGTRNRLPFATHQQQRQLMAQPLHHWLHSGGGVLGLSEHCGGIQLRECPAEQRRCLLYTSPSPRDS